MKRLKKAASLLIVLLFIAISIIAQTPWLSFGPPDDPAAKIGVGFERYPGLSVVAPDVRNRGINVIRDPNVLRQTGGGMLVSLAEPHPDLVNHRLSLAYDPSREDGNRFEVTIGDRKAYMDLFDWEAEPLVKFVESGHHGAIHISSGFTGNSIQLDDSFQQRLLGLRFIQADLLPRGTIASQKYLPRGRNGLFILGNGERQFLGEVASIESAAQSLQPLFDSVNTRYSLLTDAGRKFTFSVIDSRFLTHGTPYYMFWQPENNQVVRNESLGRQFSQSWSTLKRANPLVIRAVERAFRTTAFFRYQQQKNPANWSAFVQQISAISVRSVPTPRLLQSVGSTR
jgi:hypothetical protein